MSNSSRSLKPAPVDREWATQASYSGFEGLSLLLAECLIVMSEQLDYMIDVMEGNNA